MSIIAYDHEIETKFVNEQPLADMINEIDFTGGSTNFEKPLIEALNIMHDYDTEFDKYVLCLLTDGESKYPAKAIDAIDKSGFMNRIEFSCIYFGNSTYIQDVLQPIASALNGKLKTVIDQA